MTQRSTAGIKIFAFGFLLGLITVMLMTSLVAMALLKTGVTVPIDKDRVVDELTVQVSAFIQAALPEMLAEAREQLPMAVKEQVRSGLGEISLEIANYQIKLPTMVVDRIDTYLQSTVTAALSELLSGLASTSDEVLTDDQLRLQVGRWVEDLNGQCFHVETAWRLTIPVTVELR